MSQTQPIDIIVQAKAQIDDLDKVHKGLSGIVDKAKEFVLGDFGAKLTAILSVGALVEFERHAINTAAAFVDLSQKTGVGVEALSSLTYAARQSGVDIQEFTLALKILATNASNAFSDPLSEAAARFNQIGVSVKNANGSIKGIDQVILDVANKFARYNDGIQKSAIATSLFGREGQNLIPLLNRGSDGIQKLREEAALYGQTVSQETAEQAKKFNDTLEKLKGLFEGIFLQVAQQVLPSLNDLATGFENVEKKTGSFAAFAQTLVTLFKGITVEIVAVTEGLATLSRFAGAASVAGSPAILARLSTAMGGADTDLTSEEYKKRTNAILDAAIAQAKDEFKALGKSLNAFTAGGGKPDVTHQNALTPDSGFGTPNYKIIEPVKTTWDFGGNFKTDPPPFISAAQLAELKKTLDQVTQDFLQTSGDRIALLQDEKARALRILKEKVQDISQQDAAAALIEQTYATKILQAQEKIKEGELAVNSARLDSQRQLIESNEKLSQYEKDTQLVSVRQEMLLLLQQEIALKEKMIAESKADDERRLSAEQDLIKLRGDRVTLQREQQINIPTNFPTLRTNISGGFRTNAVTGERELISPYEKLDNYLSTTLTETMQGIGDAISGWVTGTETWGQAFLKVGDQIISQTIQMLLEYTVFHELRMALDRLFYGAKQIQITTTTAVGVAATETSAAASATAGATTAASWGPAAVLSSIGSFGVAGVVGLAVVLAALGAVAAGAFADGGLIPGSPSDSDNRIATVATGEFIHRAAAVAYYGPSVMEAMNQMQIPRELLSLDHLSLPAPRMGISHFADGGLVAPAGFAGSANINMPEQAVHIGIINSQEQLEAFMRSKTGKKIILDVISGKKMNLGVTS